MLAASHCLFAEYRTRSMTLPIVICDDSSFARKQMARSLPQGWDVEITFAANGQEGVEAIRAGKGDIMFLDLTMPVLDGYGALEAIRKEDLPTMVIVVSGDIQQDARDRVMSLGALDFIKKPIDSEKLTEVLDKYGILSELTGSGASATPMFSGEVDLSDWIKEISNVAMGHTADLLAQLFKIFVHLSVPRVRILKADELRMVLAEMKRDEMQHPVICQGFSGGQMAGENILRLNNASVADIAELMAFRGEITREAELELVMDISNILIGAYLKGIATQLDVNFSQGQPTVLSRDDLDATRLGSDENAMAIELAYTFEDREFICNQLVLFTGDSLEPLKILASYATE